MPVPGYTDPGTGIVQIFLPSIAVAGSSTTQGIQLAFECVSPSPGDNVVSLNTEFPDLASSFSVMAVPKIVINGDISFEGAMPEQTFLDYVLKSIE